MKDYEIIDTNADNIGGCGICGRKPGRTEGYRRKCDWLKKQYAEGLRYKVLRSRESGDVGVIEYAPGSHAWRPVEAEGYLVIHCLMVTRQHLGKGLGMLLVESCLADARKSKCRSVPYGCQVREGYCGGVRSPGAEDESGSYHERRKVKRASDALWCVQHCLRGKANCRASDQWQEIHEHRGVRTTSARTSQ